MPFPNNLRAQAAFRGKTPGEYSWLTPPGASALALLFLHQAPTTGLFGGSLASVSTSPTHLWLRAEDGTPLDEAMACRERGGLLLTLHGGAGVRQSVETELHAAGWRAGNIHPFGNTRFERLTLDLLPSARGAGAVGMILEASRQGQALANTLQASDPRSLLAETSHASFLIDTPRVQLWGPVNAGKSSLLNALCGRTLAAVGDEPGLTRDVIEGRVAHQGFELRLFDAPGMWAGTKLDEEALALARRWQGEADLTIELVPPGGTPRPHGWWYHSRADESGQDGLSVKQPETLAALKDRLIEHFFGPLRKLPPEHRFALHPELRADLQALTDPATLHAKWLSAQS